MLSAIKDNNPVLILDHRFNFKQNGIVPEEMYTVPIGRGIVRRRGKNVTVVAISHLVADAFYAAQELAEQGIDVELIDLRTLRLLDETLILDFVSKIGKHTIRYHSLDKVFEELDFLVNTYGIKNIKIIEEMFELNKKRIVSLCDMIIERGYEFNMWAYARVNTVTEKMLYKMKQAGINWVAYGFESGSKRVINDVTKGYKMEQVENVVGMTYDLDMHICSNFIFGLLEDDYDSMNETLTLMLDINAELANIP